MKIAIVTHNIIRGDGQGRVNYEIVRHCLAQGIEVRLFADRVDSDLVEMGAEWTELHPRLRRPILAKVCDFVRLSDPAVLAAGNSVDVVIANGYTLRVPHSINVSHLVHGAWLKSPFHTSAREGALYGAYQKMYTKLNSIFEKRSYRAAQTIVAVSNRLREDLIATGNDPARIRVIPNGVDLTEFQPGTADRAALGLPDNVPLALFVGEIRTPRKNLQGVLDAIRLVPGVHLAVAGATDRSPYPAIAQRMGLSDRVTFLGYRRDISQLMRASDFFVFPSHFEPFGLVVLEAMACGRPVITAKCTGASDVVVAGSGIVLERSDDVPALAAAISRLASDAPLREKMSIAARAAAENHSWERMAKQYIELFEAAAVERCVAAA